MVRLCAIISLILSFLFYAWNISHGRIDSMLLLILGLLLWCISDRWDHTPWRHV